MHVLSIKFLGIHSKATFVKRRTKVTRSEGSKVDIYRWVPSPHPRIKYTKVMCVLIFYRMRDYLMASCRSLPLTLAFDETAKLFLPIGGVITKSSPRGKKKKEDRTIAAERNIRSNTLIKRIETKSNAKEVCIKYKRHLIMNSTAF